MSIQYKPTKPQKVKIPKPAKQKEPKAPKLDKAINFGTAKAVKFDKPQKVKEPKAPKMPKELKAEKLTFKPGKAEKAAQFDASAVSKKQVKPVIVVAAIVAALVVVAAVALVVFMPKESPEPTAIQRISIESLPGKTEYLTGTVAPDYTGLKVKITQYNGRTYLLGPESCTITGFDSSVPNVAQVITVSYRGFSTTFAVTITERTAEAKAPKKIWMVQYPQQNYAVGETVKVDGGQFKCEYADGSTGVIELAKKHVSGVAAINGPGTYTLTVTYEVPGYEPVYTYYDITVG